MTNEVGLKKAAKSHIPGRNREDGNEGQAVAISGSGGAGPFSGRSDAGDQGFGAAVGKGKGDGSGGNPAGRSSVECAADDLPAIGGRWSPDEAIEQKGRKD